MKLLPMMFLVGVLFAVVNASALEVNALKKADYDLIAGGAACTFKSKKGEKAFFYDNLSEGVVRLDGKPLKLTRVGTNFDKGGFPSCGQTYSYQTANGETKVTVKMGTGKGENCTGQVTAEVKGKKASSPDLAFDCGA